MTLDELLDQARSRLDRVSIGSLEAEKAAGAIVVDIRPQSNRDRDGVMPGALTIERNVLEWRFAPSSDARLPGIGDDPRVILFCDEGWASSLAAAVLRDVGVPRATDLIGGFLGWKAAAGE